MSSCNIQFFSELITTVIFWNISRGLYVDFDQEKVACGLYKERLIRQGMNIEEQNAMHNAQSSQQVAYDPPPDAAIITAIVLALWAVTSRSRPADPLLQLR